MVNNDQPPPFPLTRALVDGSGQHLPGEPRVNLNDRNGVNTFLYRELQTPLFDELYPWCEVLASKRGDNISSLHRQRIKGREIVLSEDPRLHMVWDKRKFYVKPVPACLLSYHVWETFLSHGDQEQQRPDAQTIEPKNMPSEPATIAATSAPSPLRTSYSSSAAPENGPPAETSDFSEHLPYPSPSSARSETQDAVPLPKFDRKVALGFLRSYAYLIRHASDLKIAREVGLLPELEMPITWTRWAEFISCFQSIPDSEVSQRYHFGHLRMGRLDWAVRMRFVHGMFASPTPLRPQRRHDVDVTIESAQAEQHQDVVMERARIKGPRWYYLQPYWSIPVLLEDTFNYFLFAFAMASLLLSAMQVSLAIPPGAYTLSPSLSENGSGNSGEGETIPGGRYISGMWRFFWVFANATIYLCGLLCLGMLSMLAYPYFKKMVKVVLRGIWRRRGGKGE